MAKSTTPKPAPPPFHLIGLFIKTTLIRIYKSKTSSTEPEAIAYFEACLKSGVVEFVRFSGIGAGLAVYQFKTLKQYDTH